MSGRWRGAVWGGFDWLGQLGQRVAARGGRRQVGAGVHIAVPARGPAAGGVVVSAIRDFAGYAVCVQEHRVRTAMPIAAAAPTCAGLARPADVIRLPQSMTISGRSGAATTSGRSGRAEGDYKCIIGGRLLSLKACDLSTQMVTSAVPVVMFMSSVLIGWHRPA